MPDDYRGNDWLSYSERMMEERPVCDCCGLHIMEAHCYEIDNEIICIACLEDWAAKFKRRTVELID